MIKVGPNTLRPGRPIIYETNLRGRGRSFMDRLNRTRLRDVHYI